MPNENTIGGYYADPVTMYGPSSFRAEGTSEPAGRVHTEHPLYGPVDAQGWSGLPKPKEFFTSPAGVAIVLFLAGYIGWKHVFGE